MDMKNTLIRLLSAHGVTGHESGAANAIAELVRPYVDEIRTDAMGNLIATKKGPGKRIMLAAHMDQIGFVATNFDDKGFVRVHNMGGIYRNQALARHVRFENGVEGIVYYELEGDADVAMSRIFVDIGATTREEAESKLQIGDVCTFVPDIFELGNCLAAPAMDDRAGCAVAVEALKLLKDCPNEIVAVFTVQEEVGLRGAKAAAYGVNPDMGIALDVTRSGDTPKGPKVSMVLGKGPTVKILDAAVICHPEVIRKMEQAAKDNGIPYQREVLTDGGTDSGAIQMTRAGVMVGVLSIVCRYVHSPVEMVDMTDMENGAKLLAAVMMQPL